MNIERVIYQAYIIIHNDVILSLGQYIAHMICPILKLISFFFVCLILVISKVNLGSTKAEAIRHIAQCNIEYPSLHLLWVCDVIFTSYMSF
jgi:hypothetical protein